LYDLSAEMSCSLAVVQSKSFKLSSCTFNCHPEPVEGRQFKRISLFDRLRVTCSFINCHPEHAYYLTPNWFRNSSCFPVPIIFIPISRRKRFVSVKEVSSLSRSLIQSFSVVITASKFLLFSAIS